MCDTLPVCIFRDLQGAGGDSKPSVINGDGFWRAGTWGDVAEAGKMVYGDVVTVMEQQGIRTIEPNLTTSQVEMQWALKEPFSRSEYEDIVKNPKAHSESMPEVMQMYLPITAMLAEGGYEVESYWEYRQPSPLAGGHEKILDTTLAKLFNDGIT